MIKNNQVLNKSYPDNYDRKDMIQDMIAKQNRKAVDSAKFVDKAMGMVGIK